MFDSPPQQIQSVGDIVGRAFRIYRTNWPTFFQILLWPTIVGALGRIMIQWAAVQFQVPGITIPKIGLCVVLGLVGWVVSFVSIWISTLRQLSFVRIINGFDDAYGKAHQYLNGRKWAVLAIFIVGYLFSFLSGAVWGVELVLSCVLWPLGTVFQGLSVAGVIIGVIGLFLTVIFVGQIWFLAFAVISCEKRGLGQVLNRGTVLAVRDPLRSIGFCLLIVLTLWIISYPLALPVVVFSAVEVARNHATDPAKLPFYCLVIDQAWESMIGMIIWPISYLSYGLFYYDLRMRQEGVDLVQGLSLVEAGKT